jgi:hypothetical protein
MLRQAPAQSGKSNVDPLDKTYTNNNYNCKNCLIDNGRFSDRLDAVAPGTDEDEQMGVPSTPIC